MTEAPFPPDTRAKGWRFELDYEQIEQSSTWALATAEAKPWLLMIWFTAWKQVPCGSLPADEEVIAALIGMAPKAWAKHRRILMRGWDAAPDGRLYHDTLAKRVREMMTRRRSEADRKAKQRADVTPAGVPPVSHGTDAGLHRESDTGTGTSTEEKIEPTALVVGTSYRPPSAPSTEIVDLYRKHLPQLPGVEVLNASRKRAIAARWREVCCDSKFDRTAGLDWFAWFFEHVGKSRFLTGRIPGKSWTADFDFLMTASKFPKVIEGSYHKDAA